VVDSNEPIDSAIPFEVVTEAMRIHAKKTLHDQVRADQFIEEWRRLAGRALAVLKSRRAP
jgi:hypothetical protein